MMYRTHAPWPLMLVMLSVALVSSAEPEARPGTKLAMELKRGICIDRQLRSAPPEPGMRIDPVDLRLIRSMGFEFVKILVNPAVFQAGSGLNPRAMEYLDQTLDWAAKESLAVVVCIHPEDAYKRSVLGKSDDFEGFLGFMRTFSRHLARRWTSRQVALQIMTEPYGSSANPGDWNHWNRLQHRLWKAIRGEMSGHTLILSGDLIGSIEGLGNLTPVVDENVLYCFTFYEPHLFTFQGGAWNAPVLRYVKNVPYPSTDKTLEEMPRILQSTPESWRAEAKAQLEQYAREAWDRKRLAARIDKAVEWKQRQGRRVQLWCAEFGCYQAFARPADRYRYLSDMRSVLEERDIGWAYWSYNETFTVMTSDSRPFWPPTAQTPDRSVLQALMPDRHPRGGT